MNTTHIPTSSVSSSSLGPAADDAEAAKWRKVQARDSESDGRFVYAVVTTGVYCRPSCPSRRPLAKNVRYFDAPEQAEAAGFRACRRCGGRATIDSTITRQQPRKGSLCD